MNAVRELTPLFSSLEDKGIPPLHLFGYRTAEEQWSSVEHRGVYLKTEAPRTLGEIDRWREH